MNAIVAISGTKIRNENGLYSLNDLHKASGGLDKHAPRRWLQNKQTNDLIEKLEIDGIPSIQSKQRLGTFVCKELVIHYGMWISPEFSLKVIRTFLAVEQAKAETINTQQQHEIKKAVHQNVSRTGRTFKAVYHDLYNRFQIPKYQDLLSKDFDAAIEYLGCSDKSAIPLFSNMSTNGRWLVVVNNNVVTSVKSLANYSCVNVEAFRKLILQTKQQSEYLLELAKRLRIVEGECSASRLDTPIEELHPRFII